MSLKKGKVSSMPLGSGDLVRDFTRLRDAQLRLLMFLGIGSQGLGLASCKKQIPIT